MRKIRLELLILCAVLILEPLEHFTLDPLTEFIISLAIISNILLLLLLIINQKECGIRKKKPHKILVGILEGKTT